jgi:hypothetical protein
MHRLNKKLHSKPGRSSLAIQIAPCFWQLPISFVNRIDLLEREKMYTNCSIRTKSGEEFQNKLDIAYPDA